MLGLNLCCGVVARINSFENDAIKLNEYVATIVGGVWSEGGAEMVMI